MTSVVVSDGGGNIVEYVTVGVVVQEDNCPAVIVEEVPSTQVEECYSAQVLVCDDGTYLMQDVAEEQEVVTEVTETGEWSLSPKWTAIEYNSVQA
uniref:Transcription factor Elf N-terminal domain-containing protein n=1 Tax=Oryzias latipes TaxID=8090 RepID=A0A3P9JNL7_ORYLA